MRLFIIITIIFSFFNTPVFSQIQKWWETNGVPSSQKQVLQTMPSNLVSRIEKSNDTSRVFILNGQGNQILNKAITGVESNIITADGIDSSGNSILWLSYSSGLQNSYELVINRFSVSDTVSNSLFYSSVANSFHQPLGIYCENQFVYLVLAVYQADSTSRLKWLKFDTYNGFAVDSFASTSQMNAVYNYAEIKNNRIIVNGSDIDGQKNWLIDIDALTVVDWQWDFFGSTSWSNELIKFANNDMIFSVIHTSTDSTLNDANLILCDTSLNVQWTITYNSEYNLNDSIVDVAFFSEKIYIAGFVETDSLNKDFIIASLNIDGTLNWELKYDGPGVQAIDMGVSLSVDEVGDIYFTGQSIEGNQSNLFSVQLDEFGSVLWESDLAEAAQKRAVEIVTRDGNVYLSGQNLSTSINNFLILYKDSLKIESIQKLHMEMLASGLSLIQDDFQLKRLVWDKFSRQYPFRRTLSFTSIQIFFRSKGYDFYRLMNAKINREFKLDRNSKTVELILANLKGQMQIPFIHMPFFDYLQESEFVEGRSTVYAYSRDWPPTIDDALPCVLCDGPITLVPYNPNVIVVNLESNATLLTADQAACPPRNLIRCIYEIEDGGYNNCLGCNEQNEELDVILGHAFLYEIGINLPDAFTEEPPIMDCFILKRDLSAETDYYNSNSFWSHQTQTATQLIKDTYLLETVGNNRKYRSFGNGWFEPICYGIAYANYYGNNQFNNEDYFENVSSLTLCNPINEFNVIGEVGNEDLKLASGGLFKMSAIFSNTPPIYFAQPMIGSIMFYDGPDFSIDFKLERGIENICALSEFGQIVQKTSLSRASNVGPEVASLFGQSLDAYLKTHIINTDFSVLREFWETDNLLIALSGGIVEIANPENLISLRDNTLGPCISSNNQQLICELNSTPENKFRFYKDNLQIPLNVPLNIEVSASFESGFAINECFSYMFVGEGEVLSLISVLPTGRISNYSPNSANYSIKIYSFE